MTVEPARYPNNPHLVKHFSFIVDHLHPTTGAIIRVDK
jgi:hypothetical protein